MKKILTNEIIYDVQEKTLEGLANDSGSNILDATTFENERSINPWDKAHLKKREIDVEYAEPNLDNYNIYISENTTFPQPTNLEGLEVIGDVCSLKNDFEEYWPYPVNEDESSNKSIWHLGDNFSQLKSARDKVSGPNVVRIAHFDTGYDPTHDAFDDNIIDHKLERNFVDSHLPYRAIDNYSQGGINNPGHGVGTGSILAGKPINIPDYNFNDSIGLSRGIKIVPIRLAKSVVLFKNTNFVNALNYIISLYDDPATRVHIVTMSMGGLASKAWADVVNEAYDKGIFIVTAAGNNFGGVTPRTLIYPARFRRVVAACGVTYDYSPYYRKNAPIKKMQGNFGPRVVMKTAIAAFTPNMPWAKIGCKNVVSLGGAGTSSATPQIAAAVALYYQKYFSKLEAMDKGWKRVEAIRFALFSSAKKKINGFDGDVELYFGNGVLQADAMLDIEPDESKTSEQERDKISWPLWKLLTGSQLESLQSLETLTERMDQQKLQMFETEILQLIQKNIQLQELLQNEELEIDELSIEDQQKFVNIILSMPEVSQNLKSFLTPKS